jgi:hypothetical protein
MEETLKNMIQELNLAELEDNLGHGDYRLHRAILALCERAGIPNHWEDCPMNQGLTWKPGL